MSEAPRIGFGCASLGSRIARRDGLAALGRAFDAGVTWFDIAPAYGDGEAEGILGEFARGRRGSVTIATKVGLMPGRSGAKRFLRPLARAVVGMAPGARQLVQRARPANVKVALTPELIAQSVDHSLTRLGIEQVDVLSLHDATPEEASDPAVIAALEAVVASGKAARIGIAASPETAIAGRSAAGGYTVVQVANNAFEDGLGALAPVLGGAAPPTVVTHSALGSRGHIERLAQKIEGEAAVAHAMREAGYGGSPRDAAIAYLTDYALAAPRVDVVLLSMFSPEHLAANLARAGTPRDSAAIARVHAAVNRG